MRYVIGIICFWLATAAFAVDRPLPALTLVDKDGLATNQLMLQRPTPWVLLVVDANKQQTQLALTRLKKKGGDWLGAVAIVAFGNQAAFDGLLAKNADLIGVRWYRDTSGELLKTMGLPGVPAVMGVTPGNQVNWRAIGVPEQPDKAQSLLSSWINTPVNALPTP